GCMGSTAELAFEYVTGSGGLVQEFQYGYTSYNGSQSACKINNQVSASAAVATINGYVHLPNNNYTVVMNALATVGPVAINVDATTWAAYNNGIYEGCNPTELDINHVVVLVGYGEENGKKFYTVRNSWSPNWGENGYIRLARYDTDDTNCAIDNYPQDGVACDGEDQPIKVCGQCGAIYDTAYPLNAKAL
ncbi:hypothetical protein EON64_20355, partial [archaeon]